MATGPLDLWTPTRPKVDLHKHFRSIAAMPEHRKSLDRWAAHFDDVDGNLVDIFQTKFSPAFWELYLNRFFNDLGFKVTRRKGWPDFRLQNSNGEILVEATIRQNQHGHPGVDATLTDVSYDSGKYLDQVTIGLAGRLRDKIKDLTKYDRASQVRDHPFLFAINPYDSPHFVALGFRPFTRVLYGYDHPIGVAGESGNLIETGYQPMEIVHKQNGSAVPLGYFRDATHSHVSAVYYNPRATIGKIFSDPDRLNHPNDRVIACWYLIGDSDPVVRQDIHPDYYRESLGDGGYLMLNPFADHPFDPTPFFKDGVAVCEFNPESNRLVTRTPKPFLKSRITLGVLPDDFPPDLLLNGKPAHDADGPGSLS